MTVSNSLKTRFGNDATDSKNTEEKMNSNTWWGDYSFEQQQQRCWQVGARVIILKRLANEWNS